MNNIPPSVLITLGPASDRQPGYQQVIDGITYETNGISWDEITEQDVPLVYTAATLPDPATLAPGVPVVVDGRPTVSDGIALHTAIQPYPYFKHTVALGVLGQSNELGSSCISTDRLQGFYASMPSIGKREPVGPSPANVGSMFSVMAERLAAEAGIEVILKNGSLGGASMLTEFCGVSTGWNSSTAYIKERTTEGTGDYGCKGSYIIESGRYFKCTTGNRGFAFLNSKTPVTISGTEYRVINTVVKETALTSGAVKPAGFATAIVGGTVADGGLVWTCTSVSAPALSDDGGIRTARDTDPHFDPWYALETLKNEILSVGIVGSGKRFVHIQNAQSDAASTIATAANYRRALFIIGNWFNTKTIKPVYGLSLFYPANTQANYDRLEGTLSSTGINGIANYDDVAGVTLTNTYNSGGLGLPGIPGSAYNAQVDIGGTIYYRKNNYYFAPSLYRGLGLLTTGTELLYKQDGGATEIHTSLIGVYACSDVLYPYYKDLFTLIP